MEAKKIKALAHIAIAKGARGLLFYCYNDYLMNADFEKRWSDIVQIGREIESRTPILIQPESKSPCKSDNPTVVTRTVSGNKGTWLLAVNTSIVEKQSSAISMPASIRSASEAGKPMPLVNGRLKLEMEPLEVKLIELRAK